MKLMIKHHACILRALIAVAILQLAPSTFAGESADPIKIAINNWSSQQVLSHVTGNLLSRIGYNVEFHPADTQTQFQTIGNGNLHVQVEIWEGTMAESFNQQLSRQRMVGVGTHRAKTREDWWYPEYMIDICPGLPNWKALNDCAHALATPETEPAGRYLAGPMDWERPDRERIEALKLNYTVVNVPNSATLWMELERAWQKKTPILLMNWTPNWVDTKYPGSFVEFPAHTPECENDASWGLNPNLTHDCGNPVEGWLKKATWSGFQEKWSCAFAVLSKINLGTRQLAAAASLAEIDEMSPEEAANRWISENSNIWKTWLPSCTKSLVLMDSVAATAAAAPGQESAEKIAKTNNCLACHSVDKKLVGPSFNDIAAKYFNTPEATELLSEKIIAGGTGIWGDIPMPANPSVDNEQAKQLATWILSLKP